jgi:alkylation response protein AidB-like acyl-CoA dehydrogenase
MAESGVNSYKADLRAIAFTLYEHLRVDQLFEHERFSHLTREDCDAVLSQVHRFATEVSGPLNGGGDRVSCRLENGVVRTPPGFKEAWHKLFELGLISFAMPQEAGGFGAPSAHEVILQEFLSGANTAFNMYPGLTHGAADVIHHFALPEDKKRFLPHMISGRFSGTMCLS